MNTDYYLLIEIYLEEKTGFIIKTCLKLKRRLQGRT